jgi:hypothetical protein
MNVAGRPGSYLELFPEGPTGPGNVVFLFQRVTYAFKASVMFPGRIGLWRLATGGSDEELIAPFDTSSRFKYWKAGASASVAAPPPLDSIRGVDVVLAGLSTYTPAGKPGPASSTLVTSVFFKNARTH